MSLRRPTILVSGEHRKCPEPEAVGDFMMGGAKELETSPSFRAGGCSEPETVGNAQHGGAKSLRRPTLLVSGEHRKCPEPETVGDFMMGGKQPETSHNFRDEGVHKA